MKKIFCFFNALIAIVFFLSSFPIVSQEFCSDWKSANGLQSSEQIRDVLFANGKYWAVGFHGTIMSSEDGLAWHKKKSGSTADLLDLTFNGEFFLAYGVSPSTILKSNDGETWTTYEMNSLLGARHLEWAGDEFIAVKDDYPNMVILTSVDGISWKEIFHLNCGTANQYMTGILATAKGIIAYGYTETYNQNTYAYKTYLIFSQSGTDWTVKSTIDDFIVSSVSFNGADYIVAGGNKILRSTDLVNFDIAFEYGPDDLSSFISTLWDGQYFYAISGPNASYYPDSKHHIYKSSTTGTWHEVSELQAPSINTMIYSGGIFIAGGYVGYIARSEDCVDWQGIKPYFYSDFYDATLFKENILIIGEDWMSGHSSVFSSSDGHFWEEIFQSENNFRLTKLAKCEDLCVMVGEQGQVLYSIDGKNFEPMGQFKEYGDLKDVSVNNRGDVAVVGDHGFIISGSRTRGLNAHVFPELAEIFSVATDGRKFIAIGMTSENELVILRSRDGDSWKTKHFKKYYSSSWFFPFVRYGDGKFLIGAIDEFDNYCFLTSPDGRTWKRKPFDYMIYQTKFKDVEWCGDYFFGVGDYNSEWSYAGYAISKDGIHWDLHEKLTEYTIHGIAYKGSTILQVGDISSVFMAECPK